MIAFSSIEKKYDFYTLHILGDGEQKSKLARLIKSKNLNNKVYLHGYKKNINEYLNNSFCFVLSSLWEDPGFVIIEAAMNNTVILSTNCDSGPRELLKNKENSFVFNNNNKESLLGHLKI